MPCLSTTKDGAVLLSVYIQPKASKTALCGMYDDCLKIAVTAPPVGGKANKAVGAFLAELLGVAKRNVQLHSGQQSRRKKFIVFDTNIEDVRGVLGSVLQQTS